jgi:hypothetical protein
MIPANNNHIWRFTVEIYSRKWQLKLMLSLLHNLIPLKLLISLSHFMKSAIAFMKFERVSTESAIGFKFKYLMMFIHT